MGRTISRFGSAMAPIALSFAVLDLTGDALPLRRPAAADHHPGGATA
jgi:hypothetical protein